MRHVAAEGGVSGAAAALQPRLPHRVHQALAKAKELLPELPLAGGAARLEPLGAATAKLMTIIKFPKWAPGLPLRNNKCRKLNLTLTRLNFSIADFLSTFCHTMS